MSALDGSPSGLSAADQTRWMEEALGHHARTHLPAPQLHPLAKTVQRAFALFVKDAGQRASMAAISHVYSADFDPLLDKLQEALDAPVAKEDVPRRAFPRGATPEQVEAQRRAEAPTHRPGTGALPGEIDELRQAGSSLAHAYATNNPMLTSIHADFLATIDRIKSAVLLRTFGPGDA